MLFFPYTLLILLIFLPLHTSDYYTKMIVTYGEPLEYATYTEHTGDWLDCLSTCYANVDCVSILLADSCPATETSLSEPPVFDGNFSSYYLIVDQTAYLSVVTESDDDDSTWQLTYTITTCPANSLVSVRGDVAVCLQVRTFPNGDANYTAASALCRTDGGMSLTGPYNSDEYSYFLSKSGSMFRWLDADAMYSAQDWQFEDPTHNGTHAYPWTSDNPNSEGPGNCTYMCYMTYYVDDSFCTATITGAVCRLNPVSVV